MKLNDPFGRMANRHQIGYETMRDTMRKSGIDSVEAALEVVAQSKKRAINYAILGIGAILLVTLLIPNSMPITLSLGLFLLVWITTSTMNGNRYIQRYIDEDLKAGKNNS